MILRGMKTDLKKHRLDVPDLRGRLSWYPEYRISLRTEKYSLMQMTKWKFQPLTFHEHIEITHDILCFKARTRGFKN